MDQDRWCEAPNNLHDRGAGGEVDRYILDACQPDAVRMGAKQDLRAIAECRRRTQGQ